MNRGPSAWDAYRTIKRNRGKKKRKLYKLALGVSFDVTIMIYSTIFLIVCGLVLYESMKTYESLFLEAEQIITNHYNVILFMFIMRSFITSYARPGILFSSAELQLSLLPYSMTRLWVYSVVEKWLKSLIIWMTIAVILIVITPLHGRSVFSVAGIIVGILLLTTIAQWKLYQLRTLYKFIIVSAVGFLYGTMQLLISLFFPSNSGYLFIATIILLVSINTLLIRTALKNIDWTKVVETNDLIIWNLWFVNQMSKVEIKPPRRHGLIQSLFRSMRRRKPFTYNKLFSMYIWLWKKHFTENKEQILKLFGGIVVVLVLLSFRGPWLFGIGISTAIFLFGNIGTAFFYGVFANPLVSCLPWNMTEWKKSFLRWAYTSGVVIIVLLVMLLVIHSEQRFWIPLQLISYMALSVYFIELRLQEISSVISKGSYIPDFVVNIVVVAMFGAAAASITHPPVSLIILVLYVLLTKGKMWPT